MHILQITIYGFKGYKNKTIVGPFDKKFNVIVGRNGAGKSSFFDAINFVLSEEYSRLKHQQIQSLIYEGAGPRMVAAYVEILFDNSDSRIAIDTEEVSVRRQIGAKKDQYFLNAKVVTRTEILTLLQTAGIIGFNSYNIVKQGNILQMATAPKTEHLKLLRAVSGTTVFDTRIEESKVLLKAVEKRYDNLNKYLNSNNKRLRTLENEKNELKAFMQCDKLKRSLEYHYHQTQLTKNKKKFTEVDRARNLWASKRKNAEKDLKNAEDNIKSVAQKIRELEIELNYLKAERDMLGNDKEDVIKEKAILELTIKDLNDALQNDDKLKAEAETELTNLNQTIKKNEAELEKINMHYDTKTTQEQDCIKELALKNQKRNELYKKQHRGSNFNSKEDRNKWIQDELTSLNKQLTNKEIYKKKLEESLEHDVQKIAELQKKIENKSEIVKLQENKIDEYSKRSNELKKLIDQFQTEKNKLWRKENVIQTKLLSFKEDLARADGELRSTIGKPILNGLESVQRVLNFFIAKGGEDAKIAKKYYGLALNIFENNENLNVIIEAIAGNRLFHHIVEDDATGTAILMEMNRQKLPGNATFMALNRLTVRDQEYPNDDDIIPLISKLIYDKKYDKAIKFLFGRIVVCRSLNFTALEISRNTGLTCVTVEGDQVSSKGALTGGYYNTAKFRSVLYKNRSQIKQQIHNCDTEIENSREKVTEAEAQLNDHLTELQKVETEISKAQIIYDRIKDELGLIKEELANIEKSNMPKNRALLQFNVDLEKMQATKDNFELELQQELLTSLSIQDQGEVDNLSDDIQRLKNEIKNATSARIKVETEKNKLEFFLKNNLIRRRQELLEIINKILLENRRIKLTSNEDKLKDTDCKLNKISDELNSIEDLMEKKGEELKYLEMDLTKFKEQEKNVQMGINDAVQTLEFYALKHNLLETKIEKCAEAIQDLPSLSKEALDGRFTHMSSRQLFQELEIIKNKLQTFSNINHKALEQFTSLSEICNELQMKSDEFLRGHNSLKKLIVDLELYKNAKIRETFQQVSHFFSEIFKKFVPTGKGTLILKTIDDREDESDASSISSNISSADVFEGMEIKVAFTDEESEMEQLNQLSGGQKSLVALALIFAIQKCHPAPIYLFDEIDNALDAAHRATVAEMICELSKDAQFIATTFRHELLNGPQKFFGVFYRNKVSHIENVTQLAAKDFVEDVTQHV